MQRIRIHNVPQPLNYIPRTITNRAMVAYLIALLACNVLYMHYALTWYWWLFGIVEVCGFFYYANVLTKQRAFWSPQTFVKKLFWTAFLVRIVYVLFSYVFYLVMTGIPFEMGTADAWIYHVAAKDMAGAMRNGNFNIPEILDRAYGSHVALSDTGFPTYLSFVYLLTFDSVLAVRILNALWSSLTVVLIYRLAKRNFGEGVGRIAGIMCLLMPNLIYYCGIHLKETEMTFLAVLFAERADYIMRRGKITIGPAFILMLIVGAMFTFRTVLGAVLILSLFTALLLSSTRVVSWGKRILLILIAALFVGVVLMGKSGIGDDVYQTWEEGGSKQKANMEWRAKSNGEHGQNQSFAKYAGAAVFAPMIFTIPFPTMVDVAEQYNQMMIHGGNFVKNITSFFTILALLILLFSDDWRKCVLPIAIICGYLIVLVFSNFAQSERFHLPTIPFAMMFAAYAMSYMRSPKYKRWYNYWCIVMVIAAIAWNWFKLAGRGML